MKISRSAIIDILENHDIEAAALEQQIKRLGETLALDLEEIRHQAYPGAMVYDRDRIQAAPTPTDEKLVSVVMACDARREQHKRDVAVILARLQDIREVYSTIQQLGAIDKATLLNLYYPRRTMEEVSEMMGIDRGTVRNRRDAAISALLERIQ